MNYLLDTCVISEIQKSAGSENVKEVVRSLDSEKVFLSTISVGEISYGIARLPAGKRKEEFKEFLQKLEMDYEHRIFGIDSSISKLWGELTAYVQAKGFVLHTSDGLIAATAETHDCHLVTRNTKDFEHTGVSIINPWDESL